MADRETALRELLAKGTDAGVLREMTGFAAERLMELEIGGLTGAAHGERSPDRLVQRNGTGIGTGRPAPAPSSCAFRSCAAAATFLPFSSPGGPPRRRSQR